MKAKLMRERLAGVERLGLAVTRLEQGKHIKLVLTAPDGRSTLSTLSRTPGDWRAAQEFCSELKRFAEARR